MMTPAEYRAQALEASREAEVMSDPHGKAVWLQTAQEWEMLALMAEAQERLLRSLDLSGETDRGRNAPP